MFSAGNESFCVLLLKLLVIYIIKPIAVLTNFVTNGFAGKFFVIVKLNWKSILYLNIFIRMNIYL